MEVNPKISATALEIAFENAFYFPNNTRAFLLSDSRVPGVVLHSLRLLARFILKPIP